MKRFLLLIFCMGLFSTLINAQTVLIKEDFESYNAGARIAKTAQDNGKSYWTTWSGQLGGAADAIVTTDRAQEGTKCMKLTYGNDMVMLLGDKYSGKYEISFYCYVPAGKDGYMNLLHMFAGSNSEWKTEMYLNHVLHMNSVLVGGIEQLFDMNTDTWTLFDFVIDLDDDSFVFSVDNKKVATMAWSTTASDLPGINKLGAIDFYPPTSADTSEFYIDNLTYTELRAPGEPLFSIYPQNVKQTLRVGEKDVQTLTLTNVGTYEGNWSSWIKYDVTAEEDSNVYELRYDLDYPDTIPFGSNGVGYNVGTPNWEVGAKYTGSMYANTALGMQITKAKFYNRGFIADSTIIFKAYARGTNDAPGELIAEAKVTNFVDSAWNEVTFPTPILLNGEDIWITASFKQIKTATYPVTCDFGPGGGNGAFCKVDDGNWVRMTDLNPQLNFNVCIRAICEGKAANGGWVAIDPKADHGTLGKKKQQDIKLNFDATDLEPGVYTATLTIGTNDSIGQILVPCTLTVYSDSGCVPPSHFTLTAKENNIELAWDAAGDSATYKIYRNNEFLTSVNTNKYVDTAVANGHYCYYITLACTDSTESDASTELCAYINVGIPTFNNTVSIYPNPVNSTLNVKADGFKEVAIFNTTGQRVYHNTISDNNFQINVGNLPAGVYFLRLTGNNNVVKKFIKQ
ncbi:MAG: T9SS type A sorting domain-containing protein [Bacteroidales bacterium]|nr:T9SS type A sorting domain-containing protein [Bacteroidales bacterium]